MAETEETQAQTTEAVAEEPVTEDTAVAEEASDDAVEVQQAEFTEAGPDTAAGSGEHLDVLLDVQLPITVTVGKTELPFRRLLQLQPGSVLSMDKRIGQPVELMVQDILFATGDVVVVDDCFAVRIKEILNTDSGSQQEPENSSKEA